MRVYALYSFDMCHPHIEQNSSCVIAINLLKTGEEAGVGYRGVHRADALTITSYLY